MQLAIAGKTAKGVYNHFACESAKNRWIILDGYFRPGRELQAKSILYPDYYQFAWRRDDLLSICGLDPIEVLEQAADVEILELADLVAAINASIDIFESTGRLAAIKIGIAHKRDLTVADPTVHDAEHAYKKIRNQKSSYGQLQQNTGLVGAKEVRPLGDYLFHKLIQRANDENLPVQIHTGYLAGQWGALAGTRALDLIPIFDKYRRVRFYIFHASWPWTSELGAIAKNYPNVFPDMCGRGR